MRFLGLDLVHLLGHSWGGMLAMEYALTQPPGLASLTVASSPASMPQWIAEAKRVRVELPAHVQQTLVLFEHSAHCAHAEESERYHAILKTFLSRVEQETALS